MPQKINRAGKMQNYVPAGHGDESGQYSSGTQNGESVSASLYKKIPKWETQDYKDRIKSNIEEFENITSNPQFQENINKEILARLTGTSQKYNFDEKTLSTMKEKLKSITGSDEFSQENIDKYFNVMDAKTKKWEHEPEYKIDLSSDLAKQFINEDRQMQIEKANKNGYELKKEKIAFISLGNPGSGKSSAGGKEIIKSFGAMEIDPDRMKERIPEYQQDTSRVSNVHKASSKLSDVMLDEEVQQGSNLFIPKTGHNMKKIADLVKKLKENGYTVYGNFIDIPLDENITRIKTRSLETGRYTNPDIVLKENYKTAKETFDSLKDQFDGFALYDNTNGPKIVNESNWPLKGSK